MPYHSPSSKSHSTNLKTAEGRERYRPRPLPTPPTTEQPSPSRSLLSRPLPAPPPPPKMLLPSLSINSLPFNLSTLNRAEKSSPAYARRGDRHPCPLLTLDTSPEVLNRSLHPPSNDTTTTSPVSILQAPTPGTARRKRISKLQRHLGESIPQDLVPLAPMPARLMSVYESEDPHPLDTLHRMEDTFRSPSPAALIAARLRAFEEEQTSSEAQNDAEEGEELWDPCSVHHTDTNAASMPSKSYDRQWIWEKEGRRWEEDNPTHVVRALRSL